MTVVMRRDYVPPDFAIRATGWYGDVQLVCRRPNCEGRDSEIMLTYGINLDDVVDLAWQHVRMLHGPNPIAHGVRIIR